MWMQVSSPRFLNMLHSLVPKNSKNCKLCPQIKYPHVFCSTPRWKSAKWPQICMAKGVVAPHLPNIVQVALVSAHFLL